MPVKCIESTHLPDDASPENIYILHPNNASDAYYDERVDRNLGWITKEEQTYLRGLTIGIAGCGGMGGLPTQTLLRTGIGTLKIADTEVFDDSNINRQFGAMRTTSGQSKAFVTAKLLRQTSDDTTIHVYPHGITEESVDQFLEGCDLVLDEIEYWAVAGRILLHQKARAAGIPILTAASVGFGTRLFLFTPESAAIEECFGITYQEAKDFESRKAAKKDSIEERIRIMLSLGLGLIPEHINYTSDDAECGNEKAGIMRLANEGKGPVFATNLPMANGFLTNHTILYLLRNSSVKRNIISIPLAPGYLLLDAATMQAEVRQPDKSRFEDHKAKIEFLVDMALKSIKDRKLNF